MRRSVVFVLCLFALVACGSSAQPKLSSDATAAKTRSLAGPNGKIYTATVYVIGPDHVAKPDRTIFLACPSPDSCTLVDRHGATYTGMQAYVDASEDVGPDDEALVNADVMHPVGNHQMLASYRKSKSSAWIWFVVGGAVVLVMAAGFLWLVIRRRRQAGSPMNSAIDSTE